jgi:hypothetical protein
MNIGLPWRRSGALCVERLVRRGVAVPAATALALALLAPSLGLGFLMDDYALVATLDGSRSGMATPLSLYTLSNGVRDEVQGAIARGALPWWTSPEFRFALFRPLSSALLVVEHALFGHAPAGYHLHSLIWYGALVVVVGALLYRALRPSLAALALLIFAVDDAHVGPAGWVCNNHAVVAATAASLGLLAHMRLREDGWRPGVALSCAGFAAGLLAGETALQVMAVLFAYEIFGRDDRLRQRLRALAPATAVAVVYLAAYRGLGFGVRGGAAYIDPLGEPVRVAARGLRVVPALLGDLLLGFPSGEPATPAMIAAGAAGTALFAALTLALARRFSAREARAARWLAAGGALSLIPALGAPAGGRLLLVASVASAAVAALLLRAGLEAICERRSASRLARFALVAPWAALGAVHLVLAPVMTQVLLSTLRGWSRGQASVVRSLDIDEDRAVVELWAPNYAYGTLAGLTRGVLAGTPVRSWHTLAMAPHDIEVTRTGDRTLELSVRGGRMLDNFFEGTYRSPADGMEAGTTVVSDEMVARVLSSDRGAPTRIEFRFARSLDDPALQFVAFRGGTLQRVALPPVGERLPYTL